MEKLRLSKTYSRAQLVKTGTGTPTQVFHVQPFTAVKWCKVIRPLWSKIFLHLFCVGYVMSGCSGERVGSYRAQCGSHAGVERKIEVNVQKEAWCL